MRNITISCHTNLQSDSTRVSSSNHGVARGTLHGRSSFSNLSVTSPTSQLILILQAFRHFTYVTAHSPTLSTLYLRHKSLSNPSITSPTSQLILQPFPRFTYVTTHYPTIPLLHLRHSSFSNPSFASPTSQDFHLRHLASRPCNVPLVTPWFELVTLVESDCRFIWHWYRNISH